MTRIFFFLATCDQVVDLFDKALESGVKKCKRDRMVMIWRTIQIVQTNGGCSEIGRRSLPNAQTLDEVVRLWTSKLIRKDYFLTKQTHFWLLFLFSSNLYDSVLGYQLSNDGTLPSSLCYYKTKMLDIWGSSGGQMD
jgi:hypothetical protein